MKNFYLIFKLIILIVILGFSNSNSQTVTDIDGNVYNTIKIGNQTWMAENLRVTHSPDGRDIFYYDYNDDDSDVEIYGRLYEWVRAMHTLQEEGSQGICPDGWHIPSDSEWNELANVLGGSNTAGGKMKVAGNEYFEAPNTGATNSSGFNGRAAGEWDGSKYWLRGKYSIFWSSSSTGSNTALYRYLSYQDAKLTSYNYFKTLAYSIRCLKNNVSSVFDVKSNFSPAKIFPNPFIYETNIQLPRLISSDYILDVFDQNGKRIKVENEMKNTNIIIKRGDLKTGIYLFRIFGKTGVNAAGKFIVR